MKRFFRWAGGVFCDCCGALWAIFSLDRRLKRHGFEDFSRQWKIMCEGLSTKEKPPEGKK